MNKLLFLYSGNLSYHLCKNTRLSLAINNKDKDVKLQKSKVASKDYLLSTQKEEENKTQTVSIERGITVK